MFFPHRGFMALTELPHHRWGQCQVQRPSTESPWCALGTSPSPWPPCRPKCPLPLFCGCVHPTASVTFLFPFLITTAWETPPHSLFGAQNNITPPLPASPRTCHSLLGFLGVLLLGSETVYLSLSPAEQNFHETIPHPFLEETKC